MKIPFVFTFTAISAMMFVSSMLPAQEVQPGKKQEKKTMTFSKITRLGPKQSGILSLQDSSMSLPSDIFFRHGKNIGQKGKNLKSSLNVFVLFKNKKLYLVDAGYGGNKGELLKLLEELGVKPERIHAILLTHVHPDHVSGLLQENGKAVFPKALIYLSKKEYDFSMSELSPMNATFLKIKVAYSTRIRTFVPGEKIENLFETFPAYGHTPGHTAYQYNRYLFAGDVVHAAEIQFSDPEICPKFDMDPNRAVQSRRKILDRAAEKNLMLIGAHIPYPGTGCVRKNGNGYTFYAQQE